MTNSADAGMSAKFGCFLHPKKVFDVKRLEDVCSDCGRPYGFPLWDAPKSVSVEGVAYEIIEAMGRGFYGAAFIARSGRLARRSVLKIVPVHVYEFFGKDFDEECRTHHEVAEGTEHLNAITSFDEALVSFAGTEIRCHVAVLECVEGPTLDRFLTRSGISAHELAQLAVDLFRLLQELENKGKFHNDLHEKNLIVQELPTDRRRVHAIADHVRLVAVDLGSIADRSGSGPDRATLGDLTSVATHVLGFAGGLLSSPDDVSDLDYRLACVLDELGHAIAGPSATIRTPEYEGFIHQIEDAFVHLSSPWREPPGLRRFNDSYNAQTLHPFFVSRLLVDPDGAWMRSITIRGPQVITGMRGCGKTMLLRAVQFHSRLIHHGLELTEDGDQRAGKIGDLVRADGFVGLYVSATRLLDGLGNPAGQLHAPYGRLLVAYARESLRAARHLEEAVPQSLRPRWWRQVAQVVEEAFGIRGELSSASSDVVFERRLQRLLFSLDRGDPDLKLLLNPATVFPSLAEAISASSEMWEGSTVLFLLDDISTRHLNESSIAEILGTLMFSDERSAFKLTTETQTLELALRTAGLIEKVNPGRDYKAFDLAASVNERLKERGTGGGKEFIAQILKQRAIQFTNHPAASPKELLGDVPLEEIARGIVATDKSAKERKSIYRGLGALTALCVGDVGDVLSIYESMLRKSASGEVPMPADKQNEAYLEYCSRRLYHLNRRDGTLKDAALSFAEAAYDLLVRSAATAADGKRPRLRQYAQIYVRITTGDTDRQFERLRELIDTGVFVLEGGPDAPRAKTRDGDPVAQFVLTYRKLFGLSNFIGLAFADRFELSGRELERWLLNPESGKQVLLENLGGSISAKERQAAKAHAKKGLRPSAQASLELDVDSPGAVTVPMPEREAVSAPFAWTPRVTAMSPPEVRRLSVDTVVLGLGFEERTVRSVERLFDMIEPRAVMLVRYHEVGHADAITAMAKASVGRVDTVEVGDVSAVRDRLRTGLTVVDVTGLTKSWLFASIREALAHTRRVGVVHTSADLYYPLDADVESALARDAGIDPIGSLDAASKLWSGDRKPYSFDRLLNAPTDDSRLRALSAAASPKHDRLLSLLDERSYERINIAIPTSDTPRSRLARLSADVATKGQEGARLVGVGSDDLTGMIDFLASSYQDLYVEEGYGIEYALTGSKMHAVACAAVSAVRKVAECWYVRPSSWDAGRFTSGVGDTGVHLIEIPTREPTA